MILLACSVSYIEMGLAAELFSIVPTLRCSSLHTSLRDVVIPTVPDLALGGKQADRQTFQVFKTWKV
jgi:hypothetical protein